MRLLLRAMACPALDRRAASACLTTRDEDACKNFNGRRLGLHACLHASNVGWVQSYQVLLRGGDTRRWALLVPRDEGTDAAVAVNVATGGEDGILLPSLVAQQTEVFQSIPLDLQREWRTSS